jgi:GntR family transcriptional regulator of vanillate catabolism
MATQHVRALVQLREMILRGDLQPGERLTEESLADRLGMSRTPIRQVLPALAREGLLVMGETRGYLVRAFSERDVSEAIDLRGLLEGMAGRMVAERGASQSLIRALHSCLDIGDAIFGNRQFADGDETRYAEMNSEFHALIVDAAASKVLSDALAANDRIPFAAASAVAFDRMPSDFLFEMLRFAHRQHYMIVQALESGQSARVEALLREHAQPVKDSLNLRHHVYDTWRSNDPAAANEVKTITGLPI